MESATYTFEATLWRHDGGPAAWHFVTLPIEVADEIAARFADVHAAFGTVRVRARAGDVEWTTSVFRDTKAGSYLLPVKADVRRRLGTAEGDVISLVLAL